MTGRMVQAVLSFLLRPRDAAHALLVVAFWFALFFGLSDYGAVSEEMRATLAPAIFAHLCVALLLFGVPPHARTIVTIACLLLLTVMLLVYLQTIPGMFSAHPAWKSAGLFTSHPPDLIASITPADDRFALLSVALPFGFFISALVLFDTDDRARAALRVFAIGGAVISFLALVQFLAFPSRLLLSEKLYYRDSLTGVFVNRNTAATFFSVMLLVALSHFWRAAAQTDLPRVWAMANSNIKLYAEDRRRLLRAVMWGGSCLVVFLALVLTQSRGGVAAGLTGLVFLSAMMVLKPDYLAKHSVPGAVRASRRRRLVVLIGIVVVVVLMALVFSGQLLLRASALGFDDARFCLMPGILTVLSDNLPWGTGLASFAQAYAPYHNPACGIDTLLVRAHNVYLEGMIAFGWFFVPLTVVFVTTLMLVFVRGMRKRKRYRFAGNLGFALLLVLALHSLVDFSIQIPGFAISFATVVAPLVTICVRPSGQEGKRRRRSSNGASGEQEMHSLPIEVVSAGASGLDR
ncbi:O-antigen ligase family protein [Agrobacterium sp. NPDC090273]|uniref:O-antigen ligase family protein n=1 Tax=Agrobacterium sp. NPDC090273 TaxID=3363919 RepID=UPI00383A8A88